MAKVKKETNKEKLERIKDKIDDVLENSNQEENNLLKTREEAKELIVIEDKIDDVLENKKLLHQDILQSIIDDLNANPITVHTEQAIEYLKETIKSLNVVVE